MKKLFVVLVASFALYVVSCTPNPHAPDGTPQTNSPNSDGSGHEGGGNSMAHDKYDNNSAQDTAAAEKGTTIRDSTSGLGGKR